MRVATQRVVRARPLTARGEVPARRWRSAHVAGIEAGFGAEPNQCVAAPDVLALAEVGRISAARGGRLPGSRPC